MWGSSLTPYLHVFSVMERVRWILHQNIVLCLQEFLNILSLLIKI